MFRRFLESVDDALVVLEQTRRIRAVVRSDLNHGIGHKSFQNPVLHLLEIAMRSRVGNGLALTDRRMTT